MTPSESPPADASPRWRSHSLRPRFGMRGLFVFAVAFCLFFAWIGRNAHRWRQEEAALEALTAAGGDYSFASSDDHVYDPKPAEASGWAIVAECAGRLTGWSERRKVEFVYLVSRDSELHPRFEEALQALATFPEIRIVNLSGVGIDDKAFAAIERLPKLDSVYLVGTNVSSSSLSRLGSSSRLRELWIVASERKNADVVAGVATFRELRVVVVQSMPISRADVEAVASLPNLERLNFQNLRPVDEKTYAPLRNATKLRRLIIGECGFTDADVSCLATLTLLEDVRLEGITDAGLAEFDPPATLRKLSLSHPVTPEGARAFSAAHREVSVRYEPTEWTTTFFRAGEEFAREPDSESFAL